MHNPHRGCKNNVRVIKAFWGTSESVDSIGDTYQGGWVSGDQRRLVMAQEQPTTTPRKASNSDSLWLILNSSQLVARDHMFSGSIWVSPSWSSKKSLF